MTSAEYRALREASGLTQAELAYELGVSMNTISRRERGSRGISKENVIALKEILKRYRRVKQGG